MLLKYYYYKLENIDTINLFRFSYLDRKSILKNRSETIDYTAPFYCLEHKLNSKQFVCYKTINQSQRPIRNRIFFVGLTSNY